MRTLLPIVLIPLVFGCKKRPPEAPTELSDLAGFLFAHFDDEDPAALQVGTANLLDWVQDHTEEILDGYEVNNLSEDIVAQLPGGMTGTLDDLAGASVATEQTHQTRPIARVLAIEDQQTVFPKNYDVYDRTWLDDKHCFLPRECESLRTRNDIEASYAGLIQLDMHNRAEYRWVEFEEDSFTLLHRSWLTTEPLVDPDWIQITDQFYLGATLPWDTGAIRVGTFWVSASIANAQVPEKTALNVMISTMQEEGATIDEWLEE